MKKSFILHNDSLKIESKLNDKQLGKLFRAIIKYQTGEVLDLPFEIEIAFEFFKNQFDRDIEKYKSICKRNAENGSKGGRPKLNPTKPKKPSGLSGNPNKPKKADSDSDSDSDNKNNLSQELEKIILTWNELKNYDTNWKGIRKQTEDLRSDYKKIRGNTSWEDFKKEWNYAINTYVKEIEGRKEGTGYFNHRFTLQEWIKQKNGFKKFYNIN